MNTNNLIINNKTNDKYKIIELLGEGSYGKVYKCLSLNENDKLCAIKQTNIVDNKYGFHPTILREMTILNQLNHENIINLQSIFYDFKDKNVYIVLDCCKLNLKQWIQSKNLTEIEIKKLFYQILCAINHLHSNRVIHRDLKLDNILVNIDENNEFMVKIADFGLSRFVNQPMRSYSLSILTMMYTPPEIILNDKHYGIEVDLWCLGVIFSEIYLKDYLFKGHCQLEILLEIIKLLGYEKFYYWKEKEKLSLSSNDIPRFKGIPLHNKIPNASDEALILIEKFLQIDPKKRITAKEALSFTWFDDIRHIYDN